MKDDLAERVLANVLDWDAVQVADRGADLQVMARLKYDEYEGYRPGEGFLEHLASWLVQMDTIDRKRAANFVKRELVFISRAELDHAIATVYPDIIRPRLVRKAAEHLGIAPWRVSAVTESTLFKTMQRKTLVLGLGDGARIDRLRRTSELSHEQFYIAPEISAPSVKRMQEKLQDAIGGHDQALFEQVVLVDDFAGSGYTSIRHDKDGWDGRLERTREHLHSLAGEAVIPDPEVWVVLYVASAQAKTWIEDHLAERALGWELCVVQQLSAELQVLDADMLGMCERYFDSANYEILGDHVRRQEGDVWLGFGAGRLPIVLSHNTPNNSISLLWADTVGRPGSAGQRGLFPRRHRHNAERP